MAGDKVTPDAIDNARKAFHRHWGKTGKELSYIALREALGGVGSNSLVKDLRKEFTDECQAADEVKNFISPENLLVFHGALGTVHRDLRRNASVELAACQSAKQEEAGRHSVEMDAFTAKLDALEIAHDDLQKKHALLQNEHEALRATERKQHAVVAELKASNELLSRQVAEQSRTLDHLMNSQSEPSPRSAGPKSDAPKAGAGRKPSAGSKPKLSRAAGSK